MNIKKVGLIISIILLICLSCLVGYFIGNKDNNNNKINDNNIDNNYSDKIVFEIKETDELGITGYFKELYINNKKVNFPKEKYEHFVIGQIQDIIIVEATTNSGAIYAIDKNANIIGVFTIKNNPYYENIPIIETKANYRSTYKIYDHSIYIETDLLGQDPIYAVCTRYKNDSDVVVYEEEFKYLGNNKFSSSVKKEITVKEYKEMYNIVCSN